VAWRLDRRLLLARLKLAAVIGLGGEAGALLVNLAFAPDRLPERLAALGAEVLLSLGALWYSTRVHPRARVRPLVASFVLLQGHVLLYQLTLSPGDIQSLTSVVTWVLIGSMLIFPWGPATQAFVAGLLFLAYLVVVLPHLGGSTMQTANVALGLGVGATLSVVGAAVLERSRRVAFAERRRVRLLAAQRRRLIEVGRDLRSTLGLDVLKQRLLVHAARLVSADSVVLSLRDSAEGGYRNVAAVGSERMHAIVDAAWGAPFARAFCDAFSPSEVRECPGSTLDPLVLRPTATLGSARVLLAAIGPHPAPVGFLAWHREQDVAFDRAERHLAQGIAEQAFTALGAARLYEDAARASRLKSEFVSTMSHELRTPLNVIMGYSQILEEILPAEGETTQALDAVRRASIELLDLVEATLDIGRLEAGRERVQDAPVPVRDLFDELAREFAAVPRWEPGAAPTLSTDRRKLKTVLKNLVGNALKFTPAGSVRVECRVAGAWCRLRVIDTGIGIRHEDQAIVFEMFRQADSSDSRRYGGTGLGLYIVRQLVHLLGGDIALESAPGQGSVFTVSVPLAGSAGSRERSAA
jgi:signal transduction histidine kinase